MRLMYASYGIKLAYRCHGEGLSDAPVVDGSLHQKVLDRLQKTFRKIDEHHVSGGPHHE